MKTKLIVLTLVVAITVVFLGYTFDKTEDTAASQQ
jgi:hypothetical protein